MSNRDVISDLTDTLGTIADFAVGNGDVCEIIAKRARAALRRAAEAQSPVEAPDTAQPTEDTPEMNETVLSIKHKLEAVAVNAFVVGLDYLSIAKQAVSDHQKGLEQPAQPVASPELEWCNRCQRNVTGYHECYDVRCTESPAVASPGAEEIARHIERWAARLAYYWPDTPWNRNHEWRKDEDYEKRVAFYRSELKQFAADYAASLEARLGEQANVASRIFVVEYRLKNSTVDPWDLYEEGRGVVTISTPSVLDMWLSDRWEYRAVPYVREGVIR